MIGIYSWSAPGETVLDRLRRLQDDVLAGARAAGITADEDEDFEGTLTDDLRQDLCHAVDEVEDSTRSVVTDCFDGEPTEVTMVGYRNAGQPYRSEELVLVEILTRFSQTRERWWRTLGASGLGPDDRLPFPRHPGQTVHDVVLDLIEWTASARGEITALDAQRR